MEKENRMKSIKKLFEKKVDERQEMDLLRVEHFCFWLMYWMLLASIVIQMMFMENGKQVATAEWIIFMVVSVVAVVGWVRKGVWSFYARKVPGVKQLLLFSLGMAVGVGVPFGILAGVRACTGSVVGILGFVFAYMIGVFVLGMALLSVACVFAKKRERTLADMAYEEDDEDEE